MEEEDNPEAPDDPASPDEDNPEGPDDPADLEEDADRDEDDDEDIDEADCLWASGKFPSSSTPWEREESDTPLTAPEIMSTESSNGPDWREGLALLAALACSGLILLHSCPGNWISSIIPKFSSSNLMLRFISLFASFIL